MSANVKTMLKSVSLHVTETVTFEQRIGGFAPVPRIVKTAKAHKRIRDEFRNDEFGLSGCIDAPEAARPFYIVPRWV